MRQRQLLAALALLSFAACRSHAPAQPAPLAEPLRVLLLGDSISIGYTPFVQEALEGRARVVRPTREGGGAENCAGTNHGVQHLERWLALEGGAWDVIHFNFGLHDLKRVQPESGKNSNDPAHPHQADPERYRTQLSAITRRLKQTGSRLVFATTTPVPGGELRPFRAPEDSIAYNRVALEVMREEGVEVNDLFAFVSTSEAPLLRPGDVHFDKAGSKRLGRRVASAILRAAGVPDLAPEPPVPPPLAARPNVLFILADDQSPFDFRFYDPQSPLDTPVLSRLAAGGMVLDGAYHMGSWSGAVCTPSRHMIMSGRTLWHLPKNGVKGAGPNPLCPEDLPDSTLAAVFGAAGYDTMRTCKKGNSYEAANARFALRRDATKRGASDEEGSAWHAQQVLSYLDEREASGDEDPFLIYFGFSHPHDPRWAKAELAAKYGADNDVVPEVANPAAPPLPVNYLPAHPFPDGHPGLRDEVNVQGVLRRRDEATIRNELGRQFACGENIDRQVGRVLARLEAMGELDNTYVVYTADHGMAIGRHGLQGKQNLYEHTWRVPLIVNGPGIEPGSRAQGNVYLLDVLATLCELTGVEAPASNEGTSFAPVLRGEAQTVRDVLYGAYCGGTKPGMRCVRRGDWKLIEYDTMDGAVRETQLFDLSRNPAELLAQHHDPAVVALTGHAPEAAETNLAQDPAYAGQLATMRGVLRAEMERLDDPYRLWNQD